MGIQHFKQILESHQIGIYFVAIMVAGAIAGFAPETAMFEIAINPALALMLFVTFLQIPLVDLGRAFARGRFFIALLISNFIVVPILVAGLIQLLPSDPMLQLGVLLVLLSPCIDYVVTFSHLGRADARLLLAATPTLLVAQMLLLPIYLSFFLGGGADDFVQIEPFIHAFVWLIAIPLVFAALIQRWASRKTTGKKITAVLSFLPVPATALVLFIVIVSVVPQLETSISSVIQVIPIYIGFTVLAPLIGWGVSRLFQLEVPAGRAVAFSTGTRNSLVILPLAFAVPDAVPMLPAIIVTQTLVELVGELFYIRILAKLGHRHPDAGT